MTESELTMEQQGTHSETATRVEAGLARRYRAERRFRAYGLTAIGIAMFFLVVLFGSIISKGYTAFWQTEIGLNVYFDPEVIDPQGTRDPAVLEKAWYGKLVKESIRAEFPDVSGRTAKRALTGLVSSGSEYVLRDRVLANPDLIGETALIWVPADSEVDMMLKGHVPRTLPEAERPISDQQLGWLDTLETRGLVDQAFNWRLFSNGDSRQPELAGIWGAVVGSFYTLVVVLLLSFPVGVMTATYLEEFAPRNKWTDLIEVNINNLAAVPSIVFGLLGLAVFLNFFGLPRSAPVVGGLVLTLMTLPTIIISARAALRAVPPSVREAALGMGASPLQTVTHHVLPLALPGMLTGTIIGMAQALGESAPLLMIGMVAFIADVPSGFTDSATVLPVQIFLWADSPERGFVERTSAAIMVLLAFLIIMNATAVFLRKRFERRW